MVGLAATLPTISQYQMKLAIKQCLYHIAKLDSKGKLWCLDCGHSWTIQRGENPKKVKCPHCGAKLSVETDRKRKHTEGAYFAILTTCNGIQVIRMFLLTARYKKGEAAQYNFAEPFQRWINEQGQDAVFGVARASFSYYTDRWLWGSGMEIRNHNYVHNLSPYAVIGQLRVIPSLKRNGFCSDKAREYNPTLLIKSLLTDNRIETLFKAQQYKLVKHLINSKWKLTEFWPSIKIAMRHQYHIDDASLWWDLLNTLSSLGKDIRNPKYICPKNLKEAHDHWQAQLHIKQERERRERERRAELNRQQRYLEDKKNAEKDEQAYQQMRSRFFDIEIKDNDMIIKPLTSVREFMDEGRDMSHCVFTNKYYKRTDCLILHAIVDNVSVATIELNLESLKIIQCRAKHNSKPAEYDRIISLIESNIGIIAAKRVA